MQANWQALHAHHDRIKDRSILDLFADPSRAAQFSARMGDMLFDYSKTNIDAEGLALLIGLAEAAGVAEKRAAMFAGAAINETEGRAVLHTALRNLEASVMVNGADVMPAVRATQVYTRVTVDPRVCGEALQSRLATATERLLQRSESDAPYTFFAPPAWRALPSDGTLLRTLGLPANTPVERATLERVFQGMAFVDPPGDLADAHRVARVNLLVAALRAQLTDITVYRVGSVQVRTVSELLSAVAALKPGVSENFKLQRQNEVLALAVTPGKRQRPAMPR